jgi:hypothetical protein
LVTITAAPPTPVLDVPSAPGSVSFQNGVAGYAGAQDGTINNLYLQYAWNNGRSTQRRWTFETLLLRRMASTAAPCSSFRMFPFLPAQL